MKFLCLAYGDEDGWNSLSEQERREVLAQDAAIRGRGNLMSAVQTKVTSVRNWNKSLEVTDEPYAQHKLPLAGFSVIEAESLNEVVELVSNTPCARARGVIEIRPFWGLSGDGA
ncbi:MAG TPA: YciI family protein [Terriglobales bacterium]|nr:YciI family protein [Terriglobales bacterium]